MKIQNLDKIGDLGKTKNDILDSMFVQSLYITGLKHLPTFDPHISAALDNLIKLYK